MTVEQAIDDQAIDDQAVDEQAVVSEQAAVTERTSRLVGGTTPYPWPYDGALTPERTALIVAGWNDEWWARCHDPALVVDLIRRLAESVDTVITIDHVGPARSLCSFDPPANALPPIAGSSVVAAAGIDAFFGSPLDPVLRSLGADLLLLVGLGLETTVHSTMRSANDRGYECLLVVDACAPLDPDAVPNAVSMVEMSGGIFGAVGLTDPVLAALAR